MASSRKRVRSPQSQASDRVDRFLDSFEDEQRIDEDDRSVKRVSGMESSLNTEITLPVDVKEEIGDEEEFSQLQKSYFRPQLVPSFKAEVEPLDSRLGPTTEDGSTCLNKFRTPEDVEDIKPKPEPIPSSSSTDFVLPGHRPSSLLTFEMPEDMQDATSEPNPAAPSTSVLLTFETPEDMQDSPEPDPAPSSSKLPGFSLPSKIPASVSLSFGFSDDEDDLPESPEQPSSQTTIPAQGLKSKPSEIPDGTRNVNSGPDLDVRASDTQVEEHNLAGQHTPSSPLVLAKDHEHPNTSESLHSELHLPDDNEDFKPEVDDPTSPEAEVDTSLTEDGEFLNFIEGPQDAMFFEEVSMTAGQFNELLKNMLLYNCFQVPGIMNRAKLEAVLKFLIKGESIANLAQQYKIGKQTFSKFLPEVLDAIFGVLGLFRVKIGENRWAKVQKGFTERLGLPNCCGVVNAKTIITWRPDQTHLPILTITDSEYGVLNVDLTAGIEDQRIDFRSTRMYIDVHSPGHYERLEIPQLGFVVGNEHLKATRYMYPLYSTVSDDMPIPKMYNSRVERALRVSENTYGILTSKFKIYDKIMTLTPSIIKSVVKATCALHNWLKQNPGYITPGLVDEELEDGSWKLGSCHTGPKQIFQPIHLFQAKNTVRKNPHARRRDLYAYSLFVLEQTKHQNTT